MYEIQDNVPIPKANKGARKTDPMLERTLENLQVNQSTYIPNVTGEHLMPLQHRVICTIAKVKKQRARRRFDNYTLKFTTRQQGNGIRVWRTE